MNRRETYTMVGSTVFGEIIYERGLTLHQAKLKASRAGVREWKPIIYKDKDVSFKAGQVIINFNYEFCWVWNELYQKWEKCY